MDCLKQCLIVQMGKLRHGEHERLAKGQTIDWCQRIKTAFPSLVLEGKSGPLSVNVFCVLFTWMLAPCPHFLWQLCPVCEHTGSWSNLGTNTWELLPKIWLSPPWGPEQGSLPRVWLPQSLGKHSQQTPLLLYVSSPSLLWLWCQRRFLRDSFLCSDP